MKKKNFYNLLMVVVILALTLTACNLFQAFGGPATPDPAQIATMAAGTVSARFTQMAFDTAVAQLTQQAIMTNTPLPTNTPVATNTPVPPTATPIPPTATPVPIPCNAASFITDVTVKDWSTVYASETFVKTWQIKNVGSCSWTKDYKIFFFGGNQMDAGSAIAFPNVVNPGEIVNLSVSMVAPASTGDFSGSWMLKAANGVVFGVGSAYNVPLTVNIKVASLPAPHDPNTKYDFVKNMCSANWRTNAGTIGCPSAGFDTKNGSITRSYAPVLDGGTVDDEGAIFTVPAVGGDGMILGRYPKVSIVSGDYFRALLTCTNKVPKCSVTYELLYNEDGSGTVVSLGTWEKKAGDAFTQVNVDLSGLDGKNIVFHLKVISKGDSTDDVVLWMAPRITHP